VVFSDLPSPPPEPPSDLLGQVAGRARTAEELASGYQALLLETVGLWREGKLAGADRVALLDAVLGSELIAALPGGEARGAAELAGLLRGSARRESALPLPRRGLAMADGTPALERVHIRGNPRTLGEEAPPRLPALIAAESGGGRLEMARRLASAD